MASINYVIAAASYDPTVGFQSYTLPTDYNTLVWSTTPIAQAILENHFYSLERTRIINSFIALMRTDLMSGFISDVYSPGTNRAYKSDSQSQTSLIGAVVYTEPTAANPAGYTFSFPSYDPVTGLGRIDTYTNTQLRLLLNTFADKASTLFAKLQSKADLITAIDTSVIATALDDLYAITWN